jgi:hypothetical protein
MTVAKHGVTTDTADRLLINAGAVYFGFINADAPGTLLGATSGGNTVDIKRTIRDIRPDGSKGPVKGFRRLSEVLVSIKVNMLEITAENLRRALAGAVYSSGTTTITDEAVGAGNDVLTEFALDHANVVENSESVTVGGAAKTRGTDYTVDYNSGTLQFVTAPAESAAIVATYDYISASAVISGDEVSNDSYISSVALVGTISGSTDPVIVKITNALCDAGINIKTAPNDEAVVEITFTGHYTTASLSSEPWSIEYPAS